MTTYPLGYNRQLVTLDRLREVHGPRMHPEFDRRIWPWIESMGGLIGIGGGWRSTQPDRPGFAPDGKSFHQSQRFASGVVAYCALDLVARNGAGVHRAPTWAESATAPAFRLHTFITSPPEPWHIQPIEIRGWQAWVNAGRPDPVTTHPAPPPPTEAWKMRPTSARALDTRGTSGAQPGTPTVVPIGMAHEALIRVQMIDPGKPSFVSADGGQTAIVNSWDGKSADGTAYVALANGRVSLTVSAPCHLIVDVQGLG